MAGIYYVVVKASNGCTALASVLINIDTIKPVPNINAFTSELNCANPFIVLTTTGGISYHWSDGKNADIDTVSSEGTYSVIITANNGCTASTSLLITSNFLKPVAHVTASTTDICSGQLATITSTYQGVFHYIWKKDGVLYINNTGSSHITADKGGLYELILVAMNGCADTTSIQIDDNTPIIHLMDTMKVLCTSDVQQLQASCNTYQNISWSPEIGLHQPTDLSPIIAVLDIQEQYYFLTVENEGCSVTDSVYVQIESCDSVYIPIAFTPNKDGLNDIFKPASAILQTYQMEIFNRWGASIFLSNSLENGWDGTYKGVDCPEGVYNYIVSGTDAVGKPIKVRYNYGKSVLIR